jgi:hypothetical protein
MQSALHNLPTIDGVMQSAGRQFAASAVEYRADDREVRFRLDLAKAYPAEARLGSWLRTLRFDRTANTIEVTEEFALRQAAKEITLSLMTPCEVHPGTAGELSLAMPSGKAVRVRYDGEVLKPSVEEVRIEDARLSGTWGERLYRILLRASEPPARGRWTLRFTQG